MGTVESMTISVQVWCVSVVTALLLLLSGCNVIPAPTAAAPAPLTVAAAADLQFAFTELAALYEQQTGQPVTLVFGFTGQLATQIEQGAPFDLFAAANVAFVEALAAQDLVFPDSIALYARGRIVLAVNQATGLEISDLADLRHARQSGRLPLPTLPMPHMG
jgi:molybdate transport system substrate-binding protein